MLIQSTTDTPPMNVSASITNAFENLSELSSQVYEYWLSELYTEDGDIIPEQWNEATLKMMENDVMQLTLSTDDGTV